MSYCYKCDGPGGAKTFEHQACLPIRGRVVGVDWCIHHIVAALNAAGIETVASCCGHGIMQGRIDLADGRVLMLALGGNARQPGYMGDINGPGCDPDTR